MTSRERFEASTLCHDRTRCPYDTSKYWNTIVQARWEGYQSAVAPFAELAERLQAWTYSSTMDNEEFAAICTELAKLVEHERKDGP